MIRLDADVIVVGAGPTGLLLASDLAAANINVKVLEKRDGHLNLTRAFIVHSRPLETLDARGVAADLIAVGTPVRQVALFGTATASFTRLPSQFPFALFVPQYETERLLEERLKSHGVTVDYGRKVDGVRQVDDHVEVDTDAGVMRASYLVGTDGWRSVVRESLGLAFPGHRLPGTLMLADVKLSRPPEQLPAIRAGAAGLSLIAPVSEGYYRIVARSIRDTSTPNDEVDLSKMGHVVNANHGYDVGMHEVRWQSRFHSDERLAQRYRVGRVFLAGDAAHVHSPAGGQGMNTGLQDAANLSWKLAAAVTGHAPKHLLDSYETERRPVGAQVVRGSGMLFRAIIKPSGLLRAVRDRLAGFVTALPLVRDRMARVVSGHYVSYRGGKGAGGPAPDVALDDAAGPARLYEALRAGRFVLVTSAAGPRVPPALRGLVDEYSANGSPAMLVRPDGYIAWRGGPSDTPDWDRWISV